MSKDTKLVHRSIALTVPQWKHLALKAKQAGCTLTAILRGLVIRDIEAK